MDDTTPNGVPSLYSLNMSPTAFKSAINKACETAVNNALNGLQEPIDSVVTTKVAAQRDLAYSPRLLEKGEAIYHI
ncbi:uncharacterized protein FFMR_09914 [Fusarium fujikuroi]|nr:uncharacterized protein FFC1_04202 [Fusarium fujikuroi]SCN83544.1 uncharacterized protein FFE2_05442 [Fusarium fujikuroi]SCN86472.1 uncharacterized protein FFM5_03928 [Fusarium fujikuroi]SCO35221.1 uncharacterized protein FFNC_04299 [Fusarium fujikuroi]SCO49934.1 uncharacterized protein FFMR_09914 [Fusarium fujikuroi]